MTLDVYCKGIKNASIHGEFLDITLEEVSPDFIEQIPARELVLWANNQELLAAMDYGDIVEFLESKHYVKVVNISGGVE